MIQITNKTIEKNKHNEPKKNNHQHAYVPHRSMSVS